MDQQQFFVDNMSAIKLAKSDGYRKRTKHIDLRFHFIREKIPSSYYRSTRKSRFNVQKPPNNYKDIEDGEFTEKAEFTFSRAGNKVLIHKGRKLTFSMRGKYDEYCTWNNYSEKHQAVTRSICGEERVVWFFKSSITKTKSKKCTGRKTDVCKNIPVDEFKEKAIFKTSS